MLSNVPCRALNMAAAPMACAAQLFGEGGGNSRLNPRRSITLLLALAALLCAAGIAYAVMSVDEAQAHSCGHTQFHDNHVVNGTPVKGNHDHSLNLPNHPHEHQERDVIYIDYSTGNIRYVWHANGEHMHCLITKVGGM